MTETEVPWRTDEELAADDAEAARMLDATREEESISGKLRDLRELEEAKRRLRLEQRADQPRPHLVQLDEFLARPLTDPSYRVNEIWPTGGRVVLSAQFKAGKTTLVGNILRALADGDPFLDRFEVRPGARVALIDDELDDRTLQAWLTDQGIVNQAAISLVAIRGQLETFDIRDREVRADWADDLADHNADIVVLDCLRPVLDALGLNEDKEAGRFLIHFDALLKQSGAGEALVLHHMGHSSERSRGDSRILDWPDATWKLVRDKDEEDPTLDDVAGSRYFSAFGRDVNVPQAELQYDHPTRRLTLGAVARTRKQAATHRRIVKADEAVLHEVTTSPGINKTKLRTAVREDHGIGRNEEIDNAVERLVERGLIHRVKAGNTHLHYPAEPDLLAHVPNVPNVPQDPTGTTGRNVPAPPIGGTYMHPPTDQPDNPCPHGMNNGHNPDPFVGGRLACPQCAQEAS